MQIDREQLEEKLIARLSAENQDEGREGFGDWIKPILDALQQAIIDLGPAVANLTPNAIDNILVDLAAKAIKAHKDKVKISPQPE